MIRSYKKNADFFDTFPWICISTVGLQDDTMILQQLFNNMAIKRSKLTIYVQ